MYLGTHDGALGALGACVVPASVKLRRFVCTAADRTAIGAALGLKDAHGNARAATDAQVRTIIRDSLRRAVVLITRAAAPLRRPRATGADGEQMRLRFRDAFGTAPEFVPTWRPAGQTWDRGAVVRERLRCAAKIMSEGDIEFVAWGPLSCPFAAEWGPGVWAWVEYGKYRICLGARFWQASREGDVNGLATTMLHEALHVYFDTIRHHLERGPYNTAGCYERYVLVANGLPVPDAVSGPCRSQIPKGDFPVPAPGANRVAGLGALGAIGACAIPPEVSVRRITCDAEDLRRMGAAAKRNITDAEARAAIRNATRLAVRWLTSAAATLKRPRPSGAAGASMRFKFLEAFGTSPQSVPTWRPAGQTWDRGSLVRERLRCAARILAKGSMHFVCWGPRHCPRGPWPDALWARVWAGQFRICFAARFWRAWGEGDVNGLAAAISHEALHIYFGANVSDTQERGRFAHAACYEHFVLLSNDIRLPAYVTKHCPPANPRGDFPRPRGGTRVAGLGSLGAFGEPTLQCKPEPGEIAASHTPAGILTKDVELTDKGVLVTDFGVNRRSVKQSAKAELATTLDRLENDPAVKTIRITGFDDCLKGTPQVHRYYRKHRALRVRDLLGPKARAKVKFVGGAPLGTFVGANSDRAARARNRSVLIEFTSEVTFDPEPPITAMPCHEQLTRRSLRQMRDNQNMDSKLKTRLGAALGNSLAGHDDSFIRPLGASVDDPIGVSWSSVKRFFSEVCGRPGGARGIPNIELDA